jgi:hypothetical protein
MPYKILWHSYPFGTDNFACILYSISAKLASVKFREVTEMEPHSRIRTIRLSKGTAYLALPLEVFAQLVGKKFYESIKAKQNGGWQIDLDPVPGPQASEVKESAPI